MFLSRVDCIFLFPIPQSPHFITPHTLATVIGFMATTYQVTEDSGSVDLFVFGQNVRPQTRATLLVTTVDGTATGE